jgi:WhiB family transcriptional regulator, redox-sensing transcriptional regulator
MHGDSESLSQERGWQDQANCLGVVRGECLEYALANGEKFGIWGGLSERERRRLRRQRAQDGRRIVNG